MAGSRSAKKPVPKADPALMTAHPAIAGNILADVQGSRAVIEDFVPLADSLEWKLGQQYLRERGNKAFISDASPVPFVVNNDGSMSQRAAEVFFASLLAADKAGPLEHDLFVLELGIGVGLFARYFLDSFRDLCERHHKDFYDRLCYVAADHSERMLLDVCRHNVLTGHLGHYRLRLVDALNPGKHLLHDLAFRKHNGRPFRAVFLNYVIDCLPAAVLEVSDTEVKQLHVRTCVARGVNLGDHTDLTVEALARRAKSNDPAARSELLEVYGLFASEYAYQPVDVAKLPHGDFAVRFARARNLLHNYGAIQSLERLLELTHEQGFLLVNDYGQTKIQATDEFEHQRFSLTTAVGLNFPLFKAFFDEPGRGRWVEPTEENEGIHSRLLSQNPDSATVARFQECFGKAAFEQLQKPVDAARECIKVGRFERAMALYREALTRQPRNWVLLSEVAHLLTFALGEPKAGVDMSKIALGLNPTCSPELWNTLGDGLFTLGRLAEAKAAYQRALRLNSNDVRARFNLAWVYSQQRRYAESLTMLAEALALDGWGQYRERLVQKQAEVLQLLTQQQQREYLLLINLVSKSAPAVERPATSQSDARPAAEQAGGEASGSA